MVLRIAIFSFIPFICQVHSQLCVSPGVAPQIIATPGCPTPQVVATPIVATTIIDNSVSNALANALQLLIVSELIDSKLGGPNLSNVLINGLGSVIEPIASIYPSILDVCPQVEYRTPYIGPLELISQVGTIAPSYCGGIDTLCSNPYITATVVPNYCSGISELLLPNLVSTNNVITLNPCGGVNEYITAPQCLPTVYSLADIITPSCSCNYGCLTDLLSSNIYNPCSGVAELISALSPLNTGCSIANIIGSISPYQTGCCGGIADVITSIPYNSYGGIEVINPIAPFNPGCGLTDLITGNIFTPNYCGGIAEVISPTTSNYRCFNGVPDLVCPLSSYSSGCYNVPDIISVSPYGSCNSFADVIVPSQCNSFYPGFTDVITPSCLPAYTQNCFGGINYPSGPIATEIFFPPTIPAQITCNYGFL